MSAGGSPRHTQIGRYEITRWLGSGSFAAVYLAYDPALDVAVALKVLGDHHASIPEIRERFIQEARMLRKLASDRTVTVRDIGEIDGQPYFVMDAFELGTLGDRLASGSRPSRETVRHVVREIGLCLEAVHQGGLVHRDVKPSNLLIRGLADAPAAEMLGSGEQLVLADFGIARSAEATGLTLGAGTHGFMAPEQNAPLTMIDHRVDIYAATAIVKLVFEQHWQDRQLPTSVTRAFDRGLAQNPQDRPSDATQWMNAMLDALPATDSETNPSATKQGVRSRIGKGAAAVAIGVAGLGAFATWGMRDAGPEIIGPSEIILGSSVIYSFEPDADASYLWTDSSGATHNSPALELTPRSAGDISLTLEETVDGTTRSSTMRVKVVDS